jgi:hypothetical protein
MDGVVMSQFRSALAWDDLRIEPVARNTGTGAPTFEPWFDNGAGSDGVNLYSFTKEAVAGNEKEIYFTMQLPHSWASTDLELHVHWIPTDTQATGLPRWGLEYTWADIGTAFGNTSIVYTTGIVPPGSTGTTQYQHYVSSFDAITPTSSQDGISSVLIGRLFRNSSDAGDTYDDKCGLLYIDAHIQLNSTGSAGEYTK